MKLKRYLCPTDQQLRDLMNDKNKNKNSNSNSSCFSDGSSLSKKQSSSLRHRFFYKNQYSDDPINCNSSFFISAKSVAVADLQLNVSPVAMNELINIKYFSDFQWVFDYSFYSLLIYFMTEVCSYNTRIRLININQIIT